MDVLIESIRNFEKDLERLSEEEKVLAIEKINDCASLFPTRKAYVYSKLCPLPLLSDINGYESSLYTLKVSQKLKVILAVDEDPIFGQVIFTLFRVVKQDDLDKAYKDIAEMLYQELLHHDLQTVKIS